MALSGSRPSHAGQDWFGQGRTSRSVQEDTIDWPQLYLLPSALLQQGFILPANLRLPKSHCCWRPALPACELQQRHPGAQADPLPQIRNLRWAGAVQVGYSE